MRLGIASDEISFDFETAVSLGQEWGVDCFELKRLSRRRIPDVEEAELALVERVLEETGATLTSLSPGLFKDVLTPEVIDREMSRLDRTLALAERLRVTRVIVFGFSRTSLEPTTTEDAIGQVIDVLRLAAARAQTAGVTLLLENEPAFWVDCPDVTVHVTEAVASPALRINWDPCNALACDGDAPFPAGYDLARAHLGHVHVKDARLKDDGRTEYVLLGTGDVDWRGQFGALAKDGYEGYCVLEPHFGNRVASSRGAIGEAARLIDAAVAEAARP